MVETLHEFFDICFDEYTIGNIVLLVHVKERFFIIYSNNNNFSCMVIHEKFTKKYFLELNKGLNYYNVINTKYNLHVLATFTM